MWLNPFSIDTPKQPESQQTSPFAMAQSLVNFALLEPMHIPRGCVITEFSVRPESEHTRSSCRFVVQDQKRSFRVKQFFYDWSCPGLADTNLVRQGRAFIASGIVGFIGEDYKGNQAACHTRWYTQVEISILQGSFTDAELVSFFAGLVPARAEAVEAIGRVPYAKTAHSARYHVPRWSEDEMTRCHWYVPSEFEEKIRGEVYLPPVEFKQYKADSIGFFAHPHADEYQMILRSLTNWTDVIWVWIQPKSLGADAIIHPSSRQDWAIQQIPLPNKQMKDVTAWMAEQKTSVGGWRLRWEYAEMIYEVRVRPTNAFHTEDLHHFVQAFFGSKMP